MPTLPVYEKGEIVSHVEVDSVDHLWAKEFRWHLANGYAARGQRRGADRKPYRIFMHREIMGMKLAPRDELVDHIDRDPMNNRRSNLRRVTYAENCQNRSSYEGSTSKYSGVSWFTPKSMWRVQIMFYGKRTLVGYFHDEDEAGQAAEAFRKSQSPGAGTAETPGPGYSEGNVPNSTTSQKETGQ
jgi:hypothetical protein